MGIQDWDQRHRSRDSRRQTSESTPIGLAPTPLVQRFAKHLTAGRALDLACGRGGDSLWLARRDWNVTAVDGSPIAIEIVRRDAASLGVNVQTHVADLEKGEFEIASSAWDLIVICKYFQPDLYARAINGLAPGGVVIATALLAEAGEHRYRVARGQFERYFAGLAILRSEEGRNTDAMAEIVARRDTNSWRNRFP